MAEESNEDKKNAGIEEREIQKQPKELESGETKHRAGNRKQEVSKGKEEEKSSSGDIEGSNVRPEEKKSTEIKAEETPKISPEEQKKLKEEAKQKKEQKELKKVREEFWPGDVVKVYIKVKEGDKERVQAFQGIVISKRGRGISKTFTVRKIAVGKVGVERIWPLYSPAIVKIEIIQKSKSRRAKLYYLRNRIGKAAMAVKKRK